MTSKTTKDGVEAFIRSQTWEPRPEPTEANFTAFLESALRLDPKGPRFVYTSDGWYRFDGGKWEHIGPPEDWL